MNLQVLEQIAIEADQTDALAGTRLQFVFPKTLGKLGVYLCGNSLGIMPVKALDAIKQEISDWEDLGVLGHHDAKNPWLSYHNLLSSPLARLVGAKTNEVVAMNSLTVNLHLLMVSFYRPTAKRHKILIVGNEFPSDRYAVASQISFHGFDAEHALLEAMPEPGSYVIEEAQIEQIVSENADTLAMVLVSGVHYYSGQRFDIERLCASAHAVGATFGVDLAHAIGNVELELHNWNVDFAAWCSYKYLNSGPGGVGGAFVNEKHTANKSLPRFAGWWGNDESSRFQMKHDFVPSPSADGWQLSNAPVVSMAVHKESLKIFDSVDLKDLFDKRDKMTQLLYDALLSISEDFPGLKVITPTDKNRRGAQLSIHFAEKGREVFDSLTAAGAVVDWRHPSVIRVAPAPLYNSFMDVYTFANLLHISLKKAFQS